METEKTFSSVLLATPRGFCAGVERAIETVKRAIEDHGSPVYVLHEIVHNKHVIDNLRDEGAIFVEKLEDIPTGSICIFSAHGVSKEAEQKAQDLRLKTIDATCPLVSSVHRMVERYERIGSDVIIIGHHGHPEVVGTAGRIDKKVFVVASPQEAEQLEVPSPDQIAFVTQTTLAKNDFSEVLEVLSRRFPELKGPNSNICFATQNRQDAVRSLAKKTDIILVVGSKNSSNSNRLREVGAEEGTKAYLVDDYTGLEPQWFEGKRNIGVTAGASAPESLVEGVVAWLLDNLDIDSVSEMDGIEEKVHFKPAFLGKE